MQRMSECLFSEIRDLILIPSDLRLTSDTILGDRNLIGMFIRAT